MDYLILLIVFGLLVLIRRALTQSIFSVLFQMLRNPRAVAIVYGMLFLPGVFLHEISHWLTAKVLRVPTHRFSLFPQWVGANTLRFGYVEMTKTDSIRSAIIGIAPLLTGSAVILWLAVGPLALGNWFNGELDWGAGLIDSISGLRSTENLWIWLYLLFAISNSMLPSTSDRSAWLPASLILLGIVLVFVLVGVAPQARSWIEVPVERLTAALRNAFIIAVIFDLILFPFVWLVERALIQIRRSRR